MSNDKLKFRSWVKDVDLSNKDGNEYKKSFMINDVAVFGGCAVGTYEENLKIQLENQGFSEDEIEQIIYEYCSYYNDDWINFDADEIEQCTGLKDKNGKLIYEGDIIFINGEKWQVIWVDEDCAFYFSNLKETYHQPIYPDFYTMADDFKVIGNIHENPELLGGAK